MQRSRDLAGALRDQGVPVVYGEYPMDHEVALESVQQARDWLAKVIAGERPSEEIAEDPLDANYVAGAAVDDDESAARRGGDGRHTTGAQVLTEPGRGTRQVTPRGVLGPEENPVMTTIKASCPTCGEWVNLPANIELGSE